MTARAVPAPLLAVEVDHERSVHRAVRVAHEAGANGVVLPATLLASTRVPDVDALSFALSLPVPALSTAVAPDDADAERARLVALVRAAQRIGGEGVRLLLTVPTASAAEDDHVVDVLQPVAELADAFGVVLALEPDGSTDAGRVLSLGKRISGATVVTSEPCLRGAADPVLSRWCPGDSTDAASDVVWQVRRQSELPPTGG